MSDSGKQPQEPHQTPQAVSPSLPSLEQSGEALITPACSYCNRTMPPILCASDVVKQIERIMLYSDANFCCKVCGFVMSMEVQR